MFSYVDEEESKYYAVGRILDINMFRENEEYINNKNKKNARSGAKDF